MATCLIFMFSKCGIRPEIYLDKCKNRIIVKLKTNAKMHQNRCQPKCKNNTLVSDFSSSDILDYVLSSSSSLLLFFCYFVVHCCRAPSLVCVCYFWFSLPYFWVQNRFSSFDSFGNFFHFFLRRSLLFVLHSVCKLMLPLWLLFSLFISRVFDRFLCSTHKNGPLNEEHSWCFQRCIVHFFTYLYRFVCA